MKHRGILAVLLCVCGHWQQCLCLWRTGAGWSQQNRSSELEIESYLPIHSDPHNMSLYQMEHRDIWRYIEKSCWLWSCMIFSEIYQNELRHTTVYWGICVAFRISNSISDICIYDQISGPRVISTMLRWYFLWWDAPYFQHISFLFRYL